MRLKKKKKEKGFRNICHVIEKTTLTDRRRKQKQCCELIKTIILYFPYKCTPEGHWGQGRPEGGKTRVTTLRFDWLRRWHGISGLITEQLFKIYLTYVLQTGTDDGVDSGKDKGEKQSCLGARSKGSSHVNESFAQHIKLGRQGFLSSLKLRFTCLLFQKNLHSMQS